MSGIMEVPPAINELEFNTSLEQSAQVIRVIDHKLRQNILTLMHENKGQPVSFIDNKLKL